MTKHSRSLVAVPAGRPPVHAEPWEKITVVMLDRQAAYVDVVSVLIRLRHHRAISRAEIIRAFIEFMEQSAIDFTQFATADAMTAYLVDYFRGNPKRGRLPLLLATSLFHPEAASAGTITRRRDDIRDVEVLASR